MLKTFGPLMRWRPPVLEADYPVDQEVHLRGRGLLLIPSYFCHRTPVALADDSLPPTLVYPARIADPPSATLTTSARARLEALARLLGHTPAAVLESPTVAARPANWPGGQGFHCPRRASTRPCCAMPV
ncbi:hypothetical protein [Streptomyces sp. NPDC058240]|uniref:hypothetical protein n=1 Tax=Streptomyces sp. NPDC058240 TaxID=3346396 RepID=UPI0036E725A4